MRSYVFLSFFVVNVVVQWKKTLSSSLVMYFHVSELMVNLHDNFQTRMITRVLLYPTLYLILCECNKFLCYTVSNDFILEYICVINCFFSLNACGR